jgi:GNAT superfamily N-acetyltransferase
MSRAVSDDDVSSISAAAEALLDLTDVGGDSAVVAGIACSRLPVEQPWAVRAAVMRPPTGAALGAAIGWLAQRSASWTVITRGVHADADVFVAAGLTAASVLQALEWQAELPALPTVARLEVVRATSAEEVRSVYVPVFGADLAPLVTDAHVRALSYRYLVARLHGDPVGCAQVRWAAGTAYISGVGVLPGVRGSGIGTAVSAVATALARARCSGPVWLLAEPDVMPIYSRLGYKVVDEHAHLRPAGTSAAPTHGLTPA